jgi:hypothetical protein
MFNFDDERFIVFTPSPEEIAICREKAEKMGVLKNSIIQGKGNLTGFLGEIAIHKYLAGSKWESSNSYDYDIIYGKNKIDVKTKWCNGFPTVDYDCSIAAYNTKQKCDTYIFCRVSSEIPKDFDNPSKVYLLGYIKKDDYFKFAKLWRKGEVDPSNDHLFTVDTYNLKIGDIYPLPRKNK